jgi:hypothetical protein
MTQVHAHIPAADAGPVFAKRIDEIGWALLFIVTGVIWLFPEAEIPPGTWFIAVGILLLGLNAIRAMAKVPVSGFTTLLGAMVLIAGLAALWGVELPLVALGLILFGLALLYRQLVSA